MFTQQRLFRKSSRRIRRRRLLTEALEDRRLLAFTAPLGGEPGHVFAVAQGTINNSGDTVVEVLDTSAYTMPRRCAVVGFRVTGSGGLDPNAVGLSGPGVISYFVRPDLSDSTQSLVLARVGAGDINVTIGGQGGTTGDYYLEAHLPGDDDGDRDVDLSDLRNFPTRLGSSVGDANYAVEVDSDLSGTITRRDSSSQRLNYRVTVVEPPSASPPPTASPDFYSSIGNVGIDVPEVDGVLSNDVLNGATITAYDDTSTEGGTVTMNMTTGAFTYTPAAGFNGTGAGADTFTYTLDNGSGPVVGTVSIDVSEMIWFVDANAGPGGDGTLHKPFDTLYDELGFPFSGSVDPDETGDTIFVATGMYYSFSGVVLEDNQQLIGEGASDPLDVIAGLTMPIHSFALPTTGGTRPVIGNGWAGIRLASDNMLRGLNVGNTGAHGIHGDDFGNLTVSEVSILGDGLILGLSNGNLGTQVNFDTIESTSAVFHGMDEYSAIYLENVTGTLGVSGGGAGINGAAVDPDNTYAQAVYVRGGDVSFTYPGLIDVPSLDDARLVVVLEHTGTLTFSGPLSSDVGGLHFAFADGSYNFTGNTTLSATTDVGTSIWINGSSGTFTFADADITSTGGLNSAVLVANSTADISFGAASSIHYDNPQESIEIKNHSVGTLTYSGTMNVTGGWGLDFSNADGTYIFDGPAVTLNGDEAGIEITNDSTGTFSFGPGTSITDPIGDAFTVRNSDANVTYSGSISDVDDRAVWIEEHNAGTITFDTGTIHSTGGGIGVRDSNGGTVNFNGPVIANTGSSDAIYLLDNTGSTITFAGGLDIDTNGGAGFLAPRGGTISVLGLTNELNATNGSGIVIFDTMIGSGGLTFRSVSCDGPIGIQLHNTGTSGGFTITGDGSGSRNGSGGTIENGNVDLIATHNFSATSLDIINPGIPRAIDAENITGSNNLLRAGRLSGVAHGIHVINENTDLGRFEVNDSLFTGVNASSGYGLYVLARGNSTMRVDVLNSKFDSLVDRAVKISPLDSSSVTSVIRDNEFVTEQNIITGSCDPGPAPCEVGNSGLTVFVRDAASGNVVIADNTFQDVGLQSGTVGSVSSGGAMYLIANTTASLTAKIRRNLIEEIEEDHAIVVRGAQSTTKLDVTIEQNTINNILRNDAISVRAREETQSTNISIVSNDIGTGPDGVVGGVNQPIAGHGIELQLLASSSTPSAAPDNPMVANVLIDGNEIVNFSYDSPTIDLESRSSRPSAADPVAILNVTVTDNTLLNMGTEDEFQASTVAGSSASSASLCLDFDGNDLNAGSGTVDLIAGITTSFDIVQASQAALATANGIPSSNVTVTGKPNFGAASSCPLPTHTDISLLVAEGGQGLGEADRLTEAELSGIVDEAISRWLAIGLAPEQTRDLETVHFAIADLPNGRLGETFVSSIRIDIDAAGYGWYVDTTPGDDSEFGSGGVADQASEADGRIDLLTVVMHELAHVLGHEHGNGLMSDTLSIGTRADLDAFFASLA